MTDAEIMKALECCGEGKCHECCLDEKCLATIECTTELAKVALALIQRQQKQFDRIVEQLEKAKSDVGLPADIVWNNALRVAIEIVKGGAE